MGTASVVRPGHHGDKPQPWNRLLGSQSKALGESRVIGGQRLAWVDRLLQSPCIQFSPKIELEKMPVLLISKLRALINFSVTPNVLQGIPNHPSKVIP